MTQATQTASMTVPLEVLAFATKQGVAAYVPSVLEMTGRIFPHREFSVQLADDPEILGDRHIVLEVEVPLDVPQAAAAQRAWNDALFRCCPAPQVCLFRLSMELMCETLAWT